jgi:hypothetical protein
VPAAVNVYRYVPPAEPPPYAPPLLGLLSWPLSHVAVLLVAVCADAPLLVHFTAVPTFTVKLAGEKEKSWMLTPPTEPLGLVELLQAALARSSASS